MEDNRLTVTNGSGMNMKRKLNWKLIAGLAGLNCALISFAAGDLEATNPAASSLTATELEVQQLKQQIEELDQKVRILERDREIDQDNLVAAVKAQPTIIIGPGGFSMTSADSNFVAQLHGVVQLDSRSFFKDDGLNGNSGFLLRRARPIFSGTVFRDYDFNFTPDFGGSTVQILDAYMNYRYDPALQLEVGKFKAPVGLEALMDDRNLLFNERSLVTALVPNRDLGVELHGNVLGGAVSYALGLFNGDTDYNGTTVNSPIQNDLAFHGRLFFQPWKNTGVYPLRGLGFGVAGSLLANHPLTNSATGLTPNYLTDGQQKFFTYANTNGVYANGAGWRVSPQAFYYYGPLGILAEYVADDQQVAVGKKSADVHNTAWEVTGSWVLTGEEAAYDGVTPRHPFDPHSGGWGAWQVVGRCASLTVDGKAFTDGFASSTKSADGANSWSVGLNWYLNRNVRADISFSRTIFDGVTGKPSATTFVPALPENVLFSRVQIAF